MTIGPIAISDACRMIVAVALASAAVGKAMTMPAFRETVRTIVPLPGILPGLSATVIVAVEAVIAICLAGSGRWVAFAMASAIMLFAVFTAIIIHVLASGRRVACNCFGLGQAAISSLDLARNMALIAIASLYLVLPDPRRAPGILSLSLGGLCVAILVVAGHWRRGRAVAAKPLVPLVGQSVPSFDAEEGGDRCCDPFVVGAPFVLVFLSTRCPACAAVLPELAEMLAGADRAGVGMWIVGAHEGDELASLVIDTPLRLRLMPIGSGLRQALNPFMAAPLYVFVDERLNVLAGNYVGDEDWRNFAVEMRELGRGEAVCRTFPQSVGVG